MGIFIAEFLFACIKTGASARFEANHAVDVVFVVTISGATSCGLLAVGSSQNHILLGLTDNGWIRCDS